MRQPTHKLSSRQARLTHTHLRAVQGVVTARLRPVERAVRRVQKRIRAMEVTLDPLVDHVAHTERELQDLEERVGKMERARPRR